MYKIGLNLVLLTVLMLSTIVVNGQEKLSNELIWGRKSPFRGKYVEAVRSMNDGEHYTSINYGAKSWSIDKYSFKTYEKAGTILASSDLEEFIVPEGYELNSDETKLLLETQVTPVYRRSYTAVYYIYDTFTKKLTKVSDEPVMHAELSPDGDKVAYVKDNNIYYMLIESGKVVQVTTDGEYNKIINGSADWVYEEEFAISKAYEWSPKGDKIAYIKYDETDVKEFQMAMYGDLYPDQYTFKYPKAGEKNSVVEVFIYRLNDKKSMHLNATEGQELYIPRINWTSNNNELLVQTMNRHQNELNYVMYSNDPLGPPQKINQFDKKIVYTEKSKTYIEIDDNLIFTKDGKSFIRTSEKDGYNHIYKIGFDGTSTQITQGNWDVIEFKGLDSKKDIIYYLSAEEGAMYQSLYSVKLDGSKKTKLSTKKGNNDAHFSTGMKYYLNFYSNSNTPSYITLHNSKGKELKVLEDNEKLKNTLEKYGAKKKEFFKIKGAEGDLNAWMIKPDNFDENKEYPVYLFIYGGPCHNTLRDQYEGSTYLWHCMLAQMGYVVVSVDPRGTMYQGEAFKKSTYLQLGKLETEDMIASAKWLSKQSWVDGDRIGVQGWSYGGYMSSLCMTKGADHFKMGIAVAPVTNWRFYDSIYTERFMRTPQENESGYDDNSPINHVSKLKGPYLLVHGSADDNVHHQNTMEMISALVAANKQFDLFIYPNKNHGIYGGNTRLHLFTKMTNFVKDNL